MLDNVILKFEYFRDEVEVICWVGCLVEGLDLDICIGIKYSFFVIKDLECDLFLFKVIIYVYGIFYEYVFNYEFFELFFYVVIVCMGEIFDGLVEEGVYV